MTEPPDRSMPLPQAVREFLDWQALDKGRSPNTVRAYQQDLAVFVAYCAGVDVGTLEQVDRVLLRSYQSQLDRSRFGGHLARLLQLLSKHGDRLMGSTRRSFTDEYKRDAVSLIVDGGHTIGEVGEKWASATRRYGNG